MKKRYIRKTVKLNARVDPQLKQKADERLYVERVSMSELMRGLLEAIVAGGPIPFVEDRRAVAALAAQT